MYLFDPGAELSCLCSFLSLNCRMDTIENILRTARKKLNSKGQKTWLPLSFWHACLGLSSAGGPGPCKEESRRADADISRQACLRLHNSLSTTAALSLVDATTPGGSLGCLGLERASARQDAHLVKAAGLGVRAASAAGLLMPGREGSSTCVLAGPILQWLRCITLV